MNKIDPAVVPGVEEASRPTRKIAILGTTPSRMQAPIDDESWEIWTIGPGGKDMHRWDRLFEMHRVWPEDFKDYLNDLSRVKAPQQVFSVVPLLSKVEDWAEEHGKNAEWLKTTIKGKFSSNVVIDREALFHKYRRMWFSSSISYCIALAIEEGATDIGCWGIDLESGEEYIAQHAGCAYFLDLARLAGINLHFPDEGCGLTRDLNPYPDRYETHLALTFEKKKKWIDNLIAQKEPELDGLKAELARLEGQLLFCRDKESLKRALDKPQELVAQLEQRLLQLQHHIHQAAAHINHLKGERSATDYYQRMYVFGMLEPA